MSPLRGATLAGLAKKYPKNGGVRKANSCLFKIPSILYQREDIYVSTLAGEKTPNIFKQLYITHNNDNNIISMETRIESSVIVK